MTPVSKNEDLRLRDEESHGQEVEAAALPPPTEMAVNHPEEAEEPDKPSGRTNRYRFSRNQALAALAALAVVVGTATVISRAASGKTSISSSMQAANVVAVEDLGYEVVGSGACRDGSNKYFPYVQYAGLTINECGAKCLKCVGTAFPSQFVGFHYISKAIQGNCVCAVSQPITSTDFNPYNADGECKAFYTLTTNPGTGHIAQTYPLAGFTCYKVGGGSSKAGKTKAGKAED